MAANFVEPEELQEETFDQIDAPAEQPPEPPQASEPPAEPAPQEIIPEKYKGKSIEDIVKMHQEAEKLIGRQAQEVHEVRSLADQLLKQQLDSKQNSKPAETVPEEDFFADPKQAVLKTVDQHPAVLEAKQAALEFKKMQTAQKLAAKHPDFTEIAQQADFHEWVKASPIRIDLFTKADAEFDFNSADELLSTYKAIKSVQSNEKKTQAAETQAKAQETALRAAAVDTGGTGEASRKIYRRADLIKLRMTDPERYMALQDEILAAYNEGRVR
jgi:hypothetical protein